MKSLVLLSGGMDSSTLLYYVKKILKRDVEAIFFNYGQRHIKELESAKAIANSLGVKLIVYDIDLSKLAKSYLLGKEGSVVVPGRNAIFLSLAVAYAMSNGIEEVYYCPTIEDRDMFPDCREKFVKAIDKAMKIAYNVRIYAPFVNRTKVDIVKMGVDLGVPYKLTWSCYEGGNKHCGKCLACRKRKIAFLRANVKDETEYES
jgi:7-cyano-7-deazaguanine synthase